MWGSNLRTLRKITLPVLRPAILASITLVVVRSLASFAVPSAIGMPGRIYLFSTHMYRIIATGFSAITGWRPRWARAPWWRPSRSFSFTAI